MTDIKGEIKTTSTKLWKDKFIRIGTYLLIFLITGLVAFEIIYKSYYKGQLLGADIGLFTTTIKDFFQIIFFCVVITVTILSYLQAKKSLFTPIKSETFKMQIKAFDINLTTKKCFISYL